MQDWTEFPEFKEPSTSFRYEQLTEDEKLHFYKKKYNMQYTPKQLKRIGWVLFFGFWALIPILGLIVRTIQAFFMAGYKGFGLW